jgi:hypothetical protein
MKSKTTIRSGPGGWVVYFDNDVNNFMAFRSDEPVRLLRFLSEKVANIKVDVLVQARLAEMDAAREALALGKKEIVADAPSPSAEPLEWDRHIEDEEVLRNRRKECEGEK